MEAWLECNACSLRLPMAAQFRGCPECKSHGRVSPLEVQYDFCSVRWDPRPRRSHGIWRWSDLLPPFSDASRLTLGEGGTPVMKLPLQETGGAAVWLKNETQNPTWSWKDRPNCVSVSAAMEFGFSKVVATSTGNHGCAVAAYAGAAEIESTVFCHERAPSIQLRLMQGYGARTVQGSEPEFDLEHLLQTGEYFPCSILCPYAGYSNPFGVEGFKTLSFELFEEFGAALPSRIFIPVGSGDGIYGIWKGFRELFKLGVLERPPRMIACQAEGANSLARAFRTGAQSIEPVFNAHTNALSVCEKVTGYHALRAVRESSGRVVTASEGEIEDAAMCLAKMGYALEAASALTFACWRAGCRSGENEEPCIIVGSGSAMKWMSC